MRKPQSKPDKRKIGLIGKFIVKRADGTHRRGGKHQNCQYFVLDLTHDPLAYPALAAYEKWARKEGYGPLADDLLRELAKMLDNAFLIRTDTPTRPMFDEPILTLAQKKRMRVLTAGAHDG